jgi:hypothetical protein
MSERYRENSLFARDTMSLDDWAEDVRECTSKYKINILMIKMKRKKTQQWM